MRTEATSNLGRTWPGAQPASANKSSADDLKFKIFDVNIAQRHEGRFAVADGTGTLFAVADALPFR